MLHYFPLSFLQGPADPFETHSHEVAPRIVTRGETFVRFHWNFNEVSAYSVLGFSPTASAEIEVAAVEEDAVTIELRRGGGPDEETEAQGAAVGVEEAEDDNAREEEGERKAEGGKSYTCNKCIGHFIVLLFVSFQRVPT